MLIALLVALVVVEIEIRRGKIRGLRLSSRTRDCADLSENRWRYIVTIVWRRLCAEFITYNEQGWECWWYPSIGVLWTCRVAWLRWQIRFT